jgi:DNA-binding transcriptional regulator GbsR (MarR family)
MENQAIQTNQAIHLEEKSFNIVKAITDRNLFKQVKLSPTARLTLISLANMYNMKLGYSFPKVEKLCNCTGATEKSVINSIKELKQAGLIVSTKKEGKMVYYFTRKFFQQLELIDTENSSKQAEDFSIQPEKITAACHEQKRTEFKHSGFNFQNKSLQSEKNKIKKLLEDKTSYLNSEELGKIVLSGYHQYNIKGEQDLRTILHIQTVWNFKPEDFTVLSWINKTRQQDQLFNKRYEKLEQEVKTTLLEFNTQIKNERI